LIEDHGCEFIILAQKGRLPPPKPPFPLTAKRPFSQNHFSQEGVIKPEFCVFLVTRIF
jgi:hypothetical protein